MTFHERGLSSILNSPRSFADSPPSRGTTFFDYLTLFRLEKALPQLTYTKKTVAEIAYDCGFSNLRSFNRAFKRHIALTPSEYRKNFKENEKN